jgi:hypothetical protein
MKIIWIMHKTKKVIKSDQVCSIKICMGKWCSSRRTKTKLHNLKVIRETMLNLKSFILMISIKLFKYWKKSLLKEEGVLALNFIVHAWTDLTFWLLREIAVLVRMKLFRYYVFFPISDPETTKERTSKENK